MENVLTTFPARAFLASQDSSLKSTVFLTIAPVIIHQEKEKNLRNWGPN